MFISEVFYSIQGEGKFAGTPSIFIRTALCNFSCEGFGVTYQTGLDKTTRYGCDTYRAVDPDFMHQWTKYTEHDVPFSFKSFSQDDINYNADLVITGGEPLLNAKSEAFFNIIRTYIDQFTGKVTIETNGSLSVKPLYDKMISAFGADIIRDRIYFSISPKLYISGEPVFNRFNIDSINDMRECFPDNFWLKFVVNGDNSELIMEEIKRFIDAYQLTDNRRIYLMGMGDTRERLIANEQYVVELCKEFNMMFSPRIHINIWNNQEKV